MKLKIFLTTMFMIICIFSSASAENWTWIYSDDDFSILVDNNSISRGKSNSDYDFKAIVKITYSKVGRQKVISNWEGQKLGGLENLTYKVMSCYFKNYNGIKYWDYLNEIIYDQYGNDIRKYRKFQFDWRVINSNTVGEVMYNNIYARARGK